jgi:large conductance mechanosensitive channel
MVKGFREFILRGNVVDLAVAVVIGAAFGAVVTALVTAFLTPLIGLAAGKADLASLAFTVGGDGTKANPGTTFPYGLFLNAVIAFLLIAAAVYFFVVVPVTRLMANRKTEPEVASTTRECPECLSSIPIGARRCAFCTAEVAPAA